MRLRIGVRNQRSSLLVCRSHGRRDVAAGPRLAGVGGQLIECSQLILKCAPHGFGRLPRGDRQYVHVVAQTLLIGLDVISGAARTCTHFA